MSAAARTNSRTRSVVLVSSHTMIYQHTARERDEHIADALSSQIKQTKDRARSGHDKRKKR
ncbi:hypothetical protein [Micromonospora sp. DT47]|uniref:hypothetical protein n=1 Tax=Micromonospora sp. DT47 TaxID=3393431 RepID=UPI003CEE8950